MRSGFYPISVMDKPFGRIRMGQGATGCTHLKASATVLSAVTAIADPSSQITVAMVTDSAAPLGCVGALVLGLHNACPFLTGMRPPAPKRFCAAIGVKPLGAVRLWLDVLTANAG